MKVIGIDGVYFESKDPAALRAWYAKHLGVGSRFFGNEIGSPQRGFSITWSPLNSNDKIFLPSTKGFTLSYRVDNLTDLVTALNKNGCNASLIEDGAEGKVGYVLDPENNKVLLRQPNLLSRESKTVAPDRVTGLGGVFFRAANAKTLGAWYAEHLGFEVTEWGCSFQWIDPANPDAKDPASTAWSAFDSATQYFAPSQKDFMFNYRVKDLNALLTSLKSAGVECVGDPQEFSYGKFGWIIDPEGNKIELWEPIDGGF